MSGVKIQQLRDALVSILNHLDEDDSFTVIEFANSYKVSRSDEAACLYGRNVAEQLCTCLEAFLSTPKGNIVSGRAKIDLL